MNEIISSAPTIFLTGAGASASLGRHTTATFVPYLKDHLDDADLKALKSIRLSCEASQVNLGEPETDIEVLLTHAQHCVDAFSTFKDDHKFRQILAHHDSTTEQLTRSIESYRRFMDHAYDLVVEHYGQIDEEAALALYRPLLMAMSGGERSEAPVTIPIFTLNYDLAVESACGFSQAWRLEDGFSGGSTWSRDMFDSYLPDVDGSPVVLFKLHGSISWCMEQDGRIHRVPPGVGRDAGRTKSVIKYPLLDQKGLNEEPYKTGFDYLEACLERARKVVVLGTSLRDEAITRLLGSALRRRAELRLYYVDAGQDRDTDWVAEKLDVQPDQMTVLNIEIDKTSMEYCMEVVLDKRKAKVIDNQPYAAEREWAHGNVKIIQRVVGSQMERDGKVWFWCQTCGYSNDPALDPIFAFVEKVLDPTMQHYHGTYEELGEALFERGRSVAERVVDGSLTQEPPWDTDQDIHHRVVVPLSDVDELPSSLADYGFKKP